MLRNPAEHGSLQHNLDRPSQRIRKDLDDGRTMVSPVLKAAQGRQRNVQLPNRVQSDFRLATHRYLTNS